MMLRLMHRLRPPEQKIAADSHPGWLSFARPSCWRVATLLCTVELASFLFCSAPTIAREDPVPPNVDLVQVPPLRVELLDSNLGTGCRATAVPCAWEAGEPQAQSAGAQSTAASTRVSTADTPQPVNWPILPLSTADTPIIAGANVDEPPGTYRLGRVTVTLGGYVDFKFFARNRNQKSSSNSSLQAIPFASSPNYYTKQFHTTVGDSRFSALFDSKPWDDSHISAYSEFDLNGGAGSSDSKRGNSYKPRLRKGYVAYDNSEWGLHVLVGRASSLVVPNSVGIISRKENSPITLDAGYLPGHTGLRDGQLRVVKDWGGKWWIGASLESPQVEYGGTVTSFEPVADNVVPDLVVKAAVDPGWGHYEVIGVTRWLRDHVSINGVSTTTTVVGGGVGASFIVPLVPEYLELTATALYGTALGRYGALGLPDATFTSSGAPSPLRSWQGHVGLLAHPSRAINLFAYAGKEQADSRTFADGANIGGYGNGVTNNAGCYVQNAAASCDPDRRSATQVTFGGWWRVRHGDWGTVMAGAQYSYTWINTFQGQSGGAPRTNEQVVVLGIRYLPTE